jgi:hypothetical protein
MTKEKKGRPLTRLDFFLFSRFTSRTKRKFNEFEGPLFFLGSVLDPFSRPLIAPSVSRSWSKMEFYSYILRVEIKTLHWRCAIQVGMVLIDNLRIEIFTC